MPDRMEDIVVALRDQQAEMTNLIEGLTDSDWQRPSRCEGWTVADVVLHMAQTNEMAIASVQDRMQEHLVEMARGLPPSPSIDDGADAMVVKERGMPASDLLARWHASLVDFDTLLRDADPHRRVTWVAGQLSIQTLVTTRLAETWIHTDDVAYAFDQTPPPTNRLRFIARLAWRTLPYAFARAGRELGAGVAFHLTGPGGEAWHFDPEGEPAATVVEGTAFDLCRVAGQRAHASETGLRASGSDAEAVLELVRTFA